MKHKIKAKIKSKVSEFPAIYTFIKNVISHFRIQKPTKRDLLNKKIHKLILKKFKYKKNVFFIQIGSNDGKKFDPIHDLIINNNEWNGIFVEPVPRIFEKLKMNYNFSDRFIFINKAISNNKGEKLFYYVSEKAKIDLDENLPSWYDQLGSFDKTHILKHLNGVLEPYIIEEMVETISLKDLFVNNNIKKIDLIHIDTEGYDFKILKQIDFNKYRPLVILFENIHLTKNELKLSESLLNKYNYDIFYYGHDTISLYNEHTSK